MFRRRIEMKLVKDTKSKKGASEETHIPTLTYAQAREIGKDAVLAVGALVTTYVAADTVRQIAVAIVKAKV
jgi:hypothetical protein